MDIALIVVLGVLGALLGSFAGAQVWRLRARQLVEDIQDGEPVDKAATPRPDCEPDGCAIAAIRRCRPDLWRCPR